MLIKQTCPFFLVALMASMVPANGQGASQKNNAEARRDAGGDYATAVRIRVSQKISLPVGRAATWDGTLSQSDRIDAYKFSPTPARGQLLMFAIRSEGGPLKAALIDRRSGTVIAEAEKIDGTYGMVVTVEKPFYLTIEYLEGDPDRSYSAGVVLSRPEEMGIVTVDAATKAFAAAMRRKPVMRPPPEGFSLIVPK